MVNFESIFCSGLPDPRFNTSRLLEYAPLYFDLKTFPKGEMKRTLQRAQNKQMGKRNVSHQGTSSGAERRKAGKK
jgi:pre-mRNA-splicing factor ATP-dependent RNA helicase DHX15/PRP43